MPKHGNLSGPYFPVFGLNTEKYGPEKTPYLDTFHTVGSKYASAHYIIWLNTILDVVRYGVR